MFAGSGLTTSSGGNGVTGDSAKSSSNDPFAFKDTTPKAMPNPFSSKSGSSNSGNSSKDSSFNSSSSSLNNSGTTATAAAAGKVSPPKMNRAFEVQQRPNDFCFFQHQQQGLLMHHPQSASHSSSSTFLHTFPRNHPQPQSLRTTASGIEQSPVRCCGSNSNR